MLSLCRESFAPYRLLSITMESQSFPISLSTKALLVSVSVKNVAIFFPPYYRLFQLQAGFSIVVSPQIQSPIAPVFDTDGGRRYFLDRVVIHNSSTAYFSSDSLVKISTWGYKNISSSTSEKLLSLAQFLLNDGSPSTILCGKSPLDMRCGVILYKIQIVNFVVWESRRMVLARMYIITIYVYVGYNEGRMVVFAHSLVPHFVCDSYERGIFCARKWSSLRPCGSYKPICVWVPSIRWRYA